MKCKNLTQKFLSTFCCSLACVRSLLVEFSSVFSLRILDGCYSFLLHMLLWVKSYMAKDKISGTESGTF